MLLGNVHSIETFGTVDGPGIRYVIFLQGCPLRCQYCHNPDTWSTNTNKKMSVDEVLEQFYSKQTFYKTGGVTISGGEPLLQIDFVIAIFKKLKQDNIHTCIDTSGIMFKDDEVYKHKLDELLEVTDLVLLDIKHIDNEKHKLLTGFFNENILMFAKYLDEKNIDVYVRHVLIDKITYYKEYLDRLALFLAKLHNIKRIDILPYHSLGVIKYELLNIDYPLKDTKDTEHEVAVNAYNYLINKINSNKHN